MLKKFLMCLCSVLVVGIASASVSPLGIKIGQEKCNDVRARFSFEDNVYNLYGFDSYIFSPGQTLEDAQNTVLLCSKGIAVGLWIKLPKDKFNSLSSNLSEKYHVISKNVPLLGDKAVIFKEGEIVIELRAKHLSFDMFLLYVTAEANQLILKTERESQEAKAQKEKSLL
jgi:hypothetical protein